MELLSWVATEHAALKARLHQWFVPVLPPDRWLERPGQLGCSYAWLVLHSTMHQDLAINGVMRGQALLATSHWESLAVSGVRPIDALEEHDGLAFGRSIDVPALLTYSDAVHDSTAAWLRAITPGELDVVPPSSERLEAAGVSFDDVAWIHRRWAKQPGAWFVQWEAIGHTLLHQGEMASMRIRLGVRA